MNAQDLIDYWKIGADHTWETAEALIKLKRYDHAFFFVHLSIEKLLKGLVVKKIGERVPPIHDLQKLAQLAGLELDLQQAKDFGEMTTWNVGARYDEIKFNFYKKATKEFSEIWFKKAKEYYLWLKSQF